jgi:virginiamycin B lyase
MRALSMPMFPFVTTLAVMACGSASDDGARSTGSGVSGNPAYVWGVNASQQIFYLEPGTTSWHYVAGALVDVSVAQDGTVVGVNAAGQIWQYQSGNWSYIPGTLTEISAGSATDIWGVNAAQQIYRYNQSSSSWTQIPGALVEVSAASDGTVWGVNASGQIWSYVPSANSWNGIPGSLAQVSVGSANNVWGVNASQQIFHWNGSGWTEMPGSLTNVAAGADGSVYGINASQQIYQYNAAANNWTQLPGALVQISDGGAPAPPPPPPPPPLTVSPVAATPGAGRQSAISQPNGQVILYETTGAGYVWLGLAGTTTWQGLPSGETWSESMFARNVDGRLELFALNDDGNVYHNWQTSVNSGLSGWSGWNQLGNFPNTIPASGGGAYGAEPACMGQNRDGTLMVFAYGNGPDGGSGCEEGAGQMYFATQTQTTPGGTWSDWSTIPGCFLSSAIGQCSAAQNEDGRVELFVPDQHGHIYHAWQTSPGGWWTDFTELPTLSGGNQLFLPYAWPRTWGILDVYSEVQQPASTTNYVYRSWQETPGGTYSSWTQLSEIDFDLGMIGSPDGQGRMFLFSSVWGPGQPGFFVNHETYPNGPWTGFQQLYWRDGTGLNGRVYGVAQRMDNGHVVIIASGNASPLTLASNESDDSGNFYAPNWISLENP